MNAQPVIPSPQQQAVIGWVRDGSGSAFVEAVAGAGKTTTLINALTETRGSVAFAAYNRKIADEIKAKTARLNFGNRVRVGTFHSFGLNAWRRVYPSVESGPEAARKKDDMTVAKYRSIKSPEKLDAFALKLCDLAKQRALGLFGSVDDRSEWYKIVDHFDLAYDLEAQDEGDVTIEKGIELAIRTLKYHRELCPKIINFTDMIYAPVVSGIRMWQNDWVFADEAQDTNPARRALGRQMLKPNGRSIWVGDRHQSLYGFQGADSDAVDQIVRDFSCSTLPLTVSYRCPKAVVAEAQKVVSHIQAHEAAPEGTVGTIEYQEFLKPEFTKTLLASDAVLCRKTRPLVSTAYALIKQGVACHVEGREIGAGLVKLINRFAGRGRGNKPDTMEQFRDRLLAYVEKETAKLIAKGRETQAEALSDRVETVLVIMDSIPPAATVDELRAKIEMLFSDSEHEKRPTLTLSTVHRSKGREWPRVFILGRYEYMPSPYARQIWQQVQENCAIYVAVTRAQRELVLVNGVEQSK